MAVNNPSACMVAQPLRPTRAETLAPQAAGTHYPANRGDLSEDLARALVNARTSSIEQAKLVIAPLSPLADCGAVAASAMANLANRRGQIRKVVVLGPARRSALRGFAIPSYAALSTPLGAIPVDQVNLRKLGDMPQVSVVDKGFEDESAIETILPLLQVCLDRFELTPVLVGNVYPNVVAQVLAALWGGPETLIVVMSDLSQHLPEDKARAFDAETRGLIETLAGDLISTTRADGHRIIAGALQRAAALDLRVTGIDLRTSATGPNRVRGHGAFAFESAQTARLGVAERQYLLRAAAQAVQAAALNPLAPPRHLMNARLPLSLSAVRATTVTLERDGCLRGSAGGLRPYRPLLTDVVERANEAATSDVRFSPVTAGEIDGLNLSISITSTPRVIAAESQEALLAAIIPGRDGLILEERGRSAILLPTVWSSIADPALFVAALQQKAGLDASYWSPGMIIRRFSAETFSGRVSDLIAPGA